MKTALVLGAGGFIGNNLVTYLKDKGYWVRGVDIKKPDYGKSNADEFLLYDLRKYSNVEAVFRLEKTMKFSFHKLPFSEAFGFDKVFQLAADMGGIGYISGGNDGDIMYNSALINLNVAGVLKSYPETRLVYTSSACIYPEYNQNSPEEVNCKEESAYPAQPDSEYGWEKLFSERLYKSFINDFNLNINIARLHNIYGPLGTWDGGREKAPAALCRKIAKTEDGGIIEIWGDGSQTRSFLYIDACLEGLYRLSECDIIEPVNIGSTEMVTITELAELIIDISKKDIHIKYVDGPTGVNARNSDNDFIKERLGWEPRYSLRKGLEKTYKWIESQVNDA